MTALSEKEIMAMVQELDESEASFRKLMKPGNLIQIKKNNWVLTRIERLNILRPEEKEEIRRRRKALKENIGNNDGWEFIGDLSVEDDSFSQKAIGYQFTPGQALLFLGYHSYPNRIDWGAHGEHVIASGPEEQPKTDDSEVPAWLWENKIYIGWIDPQSFVIIGQEEEEEENKQ